MKKILQILVIVLMILTTGFAQTPEQMEAMGIDKNSSNQKAITFNKSLFEIPQGGLLLVPESGADRIIALDPETGDVVDENFIDGSGVFSTPIKVLQSLDKSTLYISDQVGDVVHEVDNDGNYLGVFAPAGGANPGILDNVRGLAYREGTDHILVCDGNNDVVSEFDNSGTLSGSFTTPGFIDPFDIVYWAVNDQYLVCDISGSGATDAIRVFDNAGAYVSDFATGIAFPEQISLSPSGNILVATFSSPSGVYEYLPDGTQVGYYNVVEGCRGVYELPNGNLLVTSGTGIYEVSKSNTLVDTKIEVSGASMRFVSFVSPPSSGVNVTFQVDMSQQTVPAEGVHVAGSFQGWDPGATAMTDMGNGIYTFSQSFTAGEYIEYKYVNGDEWGEDESVPAGCAQNNNRYLTIPSTDTTLVAVCFGSCEPCGNATEVTLQVDMSEQTVSSNGIHVAGSFQGWNPSGTVLDLIGDNIYATTVTVSEGETIEYKFINGNAWGDEESVPSECGIPDGVGGYNRFFEVPVGGGTVDVVCFGSCDPCGVIPDLVDVTFQVDMSEQTVSADGIHIAGDFQGWDPGANEMAFAANDIYVITFPLVVGSHYQFKFINGNTWDGEEIVPSECGEDNGSGGYNRFIDVPDENTTLEALCFGSCEPCGVTPTEHIVTFRVDMSEQTVSGDGVHLTGDFQGWDPAATAMNLIADNIYAVDVPLFEGYHYQYKFINGNSWDGEEIVPEDCGEDNGQGGFNRYVDVPDMDTTMVALCFSSCETCTGTSVQLEKLSENLALSPNPFDDQIRLSFTGPKSVNLNVELINMMGAVMANDQNVLLQSGAFYSLDALNKLSEGIYFLRVTALDPNGNHSVITKKLVKK